MSLYFTNRVECQEPSDFHKGLEKHGYILKDKVQFPFAKRPRSNLILYTQNTQIFAPQILHNTTNTFIVLRTALNVCPDTQNA